MTVQNLLTNDEDRDIQRTLNLAVSRDLEDVDLKYHALVRIWRLYSREIRYSKYSNLENYSRTKKEYAEAIVTWMRSDSIATTHREKTEVRDDSTY